FSMPGQGGDPAPQQVTVTATDGSPVVITQTQVIYEGAGAPDWLKAEIGAAAGDSPSAVTVHAHISGLAQGNHEATLYITSPSAANSPVPLHVTLALPPPKTVVGTGQLLFEARPFDNIPPQPLLISNAGAPAAEAPTFFVTYQGGGHEWLDV